MGGSLDFGTSLEVDHVFFPTSNSLRLLFPRFKAMLFSSSSDELSGRATTRIECGHLNAYQAHPQHPRWKLLALLKSPPLQNETCQFLLRARILRRQSLLLLPLL